MSKVPADARPAKDKVTVRRWRQRDIPRILAVQHAAYAGLPPHQIGDERLLKLQLRAFPEGQFVAELDGQVVGYTCTLIVQLEDENTLYSFAEITGDGTFTTHNPSGDTLYGADIAVHPDFQRRGVAQALYQRRKQLLKQYNLRRMVAGGRIPGYAAFAGKLTPEQYVAKVVAGELRDPTLSPQIKAGYHVKGVVMEYLDDAQSLNFATYLVFDNPRYDAARRRIAASIARRPARKVRLCAAQYEMKRINTWEEFEQQVQYFVSCANEYHCHFLLFPELFTVQLFSMMDPHLEAVELMGQLAELTERYTAMFRRMAQETGIYIIGGSTPVVINGERRNCAHLFCPDGQVHLQDKLHITPDERELYGLVPGEGLKVFDSPLCRFAIQVCYDIEFPETARLLTLAGAELFFVPFSTDDRKAYQRVRYCCQARAVENYIYVAAAGNVGNLPNVASFLINYGQAAVFTPSDFPFPVNAIQAEADSNTETVVITELDLTDLVRQRETGSVRPLRDRRVDLYSLHGRTPVELVRLG